MAIRNTAAVYINGINLTAFTVFPLKWGNLLDERLDEMYLSLRHCPIENFKPLTPVEIHYSNQLYFGSANVGNPETLVKRYLIADDANATENPVGKGLYDHDLYIIELTKILECVVVDTNTITNVLGRYYTGAPSLVVPTIEKDGNYGGPSMDDRDPVTPAYFVSPLAYGPFFFAAATVVFPYETSVVGSGDALQYSLTITSNGIQVFQNTYSIYYNNTEGQNIGASINLTNSQYTVVYEYRKETNDPYYGWGTVKATYEFTVVNNEYPLKKWTIMDVINRLLDIAEPIRQGETPRFRLQGMNADGTYQAGSQAAKFDTVLAPQFSFTKSTLRECLQQVGGVIHGEPRADIAQDSDGTYYYEISYDLYGQTERSGIYAKPYIGKTVSQLADSYASQLDAPAENLVNQLDKYSGVIVEPYQGGYKTVRTETMYARITDENMLIQTQFPIYSVEKLACGYVPNNEAETYPPTDLTPYVFESSLYNTRLSSYSSSFPNSKAFAIMYTQGQRNLTALNFKQEHPISSVFANYAIINVIGRAAAADIDIPLGPSDSPRNNDYPQLAFRVTYTPFYTARVEQTKTNYKDYPVPAALVYNQQANVIESRYFGENLKGAVARIGNVEKAVTLNLARLSEVPEAGQMYDEDYYISAVSVEFLPTYIKCTVGLSKDFNRLSEYIGISSVKRFSEVSQGQAVERNTLWREFIVIGDAMTADSDCRIGDTFMETVRNTITQSSPMSPLTVVSAWGLSYDNSTLPAVQLPLISSAFGNSVSFSWEYEDNYSAGAISQYAEGNGVQGYFQNNYQYTDYYGRMYWYAFDLNTQGFVPDPYVNTNITSQVNTEIAEDGTSVTFSFSNPDRNRVSLSVTVYEQVGSSSIPFTYSQTTTGTSVTIGQRQGGTITSATVNSATMQAPNIGGQTSLGTRLPGLPDFNRPSASSGYVSTLGQQPYLLRKDNREKLQCNFQIDFVTNRKGLIVGSALAAYNSCVRGRDLMLEARLYVFNEPLNKFIDHVEGHVNVDLSTMPYTSVTVSSVANGQFSVTAANFTSAGKSWAIVSRQSEKSENVEDDHGNIVAQTVQYGGDVLLAQNQNISAGDPFTPIYFTKKKEVFDKTVWKTLR